MVQGALRVGGSVSSPTSMPSPPGPGLPRNQKHLQQQHHQQPHSLLPGAAPVDAARGTKPQECPANPPTVASGTPPQVASPAVKRPSSHASSTREVHSHQPNQPPTHPFPTPPSSLPYKPAPPSELHVQGHAHGPGHDPSAHLASSPPNALASPEAALAVAADLAAAVVDIQSHLAHHPRPHAPGTTYRRPSSGAHGLGGPFTPSPPPAPPRQPSQPPAGLAQQQQQQLQQQYCGPRQGYSPLHVHSQRQQALTRQRSNPGTPAAGAGTSGCGSDPCEAAAAVAPVQPRVASCGSPSSLPAHPTFQHGAVDQHPVQGPGAAAPKPPGYYISASAVGAPLDWDGPDGVPLASPRRPYTGQAGLQGQRGTADGLGLAGAVAVGGADGWSLGGVSGVAGGAEHRGLVLWGLDMWLRGVLLSAYRSKGAMLGLGLWVCRAGAIATLVQRHGSYDLGSPPGNTA